jgi:enoyl reductase-like protein
MRRAGVEGAAETVLLDQPFGVVAGDEVADGVADLVDGLEDAAMDDLLFQRPEQPLDDAVGLGFSDEGVARRP